MTTQISATSALKLLRHLTVCTLTVLALGTPLTVEAADANRLVYLDGSDPYYVHRDFPKLTTPMWVGEEGVEAVVLLSIDDMSDPVKYEAYLRPILDRLKEIDGRAPVTIFANKPDPADPVMQAMLKDGCSIDVHTISHPCPLLHDKGFDWAHDDVHDCTALLNQIPNNTPVAYRMPCCDSQNTPSPRFYEGIFDGVAKDGSFLSIDSSIFNITTPNDPALPRELVLDPDGQERFRKYLPFSSFVNTIEDYPYPYVINQVCWELPATVPSDWEAQNLNGVNAPRSVEDMKAAIDATVIKQGVYTLVYHPHGWIENSQVVDLIDHVVATHGSKVKFLNMAEVNERLTKNLLAGQGLRDGEGSDNGVRLLDLNQDGYQDVVIGNGVVQQTRVWNNADKTWQEQPLPFSVVKANGIMSGVRFSTGLDARGDTVAVLPAGEAYAYNREGWAPLADVAGATAALNLAKDGEDAGLRFRDLDGDGITELIVGTATENGVYQWQEGWKRLDFTLPEGVRFINAAGQDLGLRFVDLDEDGDDDIVFSNQDLSGVYLFQDLKTGWGPSTLAAGETIPAITVDGKNNGVWFHSRHLWMMNEHTAALPDLVDRRSFNELLGTTVTATSTPENAVETLHLRPGYQADLVVSEPLVMDPVAMEWGADGALWVMEMRDYPRGLDDEENKPGSRVRLLRDTNGDGRYDQSTIFLDGLGFATGLHPWRNGVLVTAAPHILFAVDTDGDDKADTQEILYEGFGEGNQQHRVNGLRWGLDNWLHGANGDSSGDIRSLLSDDQMTLRGRDFRIQPDEGRIQPLAGQTQYGRSRDNWGNWFGCNNSNQGYHFALTDHYTQRNPHIPVPDARVTLMPDRNNYPVSRVLARFNDHDQANKFTSICGIEVYRDTLLGAPFMHNTFACEPVHNLVTRAQINTNGYTFAGQRAPGEETSEFVASTDNWFRPVMVRNGPDGALWIADMHRETIEHPEYISELDQARTDFTKGNDMGRIFRVYPVGVQPRPFKRLDTLSATELVAALEDVNPWVRDTAQRLLFERQDETALPALKALVTEGQQPLARVHALGALDGMKALTPELLLSCLTPGTDPGLQRHAIRLSDPYLNEVPELAERVLAAMKSGDYQLRLQAAYSLGELNDPRAPIALGELLLQHQEDRIVGAAVFSGLDESDLPHIIDTLATWTRSDRVDDTRAKQLVAMVTRMAELSKQPDLLTDFARTILAFDDMPVTRVFLAAQSLLATARQQATVSALLDDGGLLEPATNAARKIAPDHQQPDALRLAAFDMLGRDAVELEKDVTLLQSLIQPQEALAVVHGAIQALSRCGGTESLGSLLTRWSTFTHDMRGSVLDILLGQDAGVALIVAHLESGDITTRQLDAVQRQRLLTHSDPAIQQRVETLMTGLVDADRAAVIERFRAAADLTGERAAGQAIFAERCATCHQVGDLGFVVGPDLSAAASGSFETLITAILDPNRSVEGRYTSYTVETTNLETITGVLASESANDITLTNAGGVAQTILRTEIESMTAGDLSIMPLGLEEGLSEQDMANLIAFVRGKDRKPKSFPNNHPELVTPNDAQVLELLATNAEIYGDTLVYEADYNNLGYWGSANDHAVWKLKTEAGGTYDVVMEYCCDNTSTGNSYRLEVGQNLLTGVVTGTGTWDRYFTRKIGQIKLEPGEQRLVFRPDGPLKNVLIDLRALRLEPAE